MCMFLFYFPNIIYNSNAIRDVAYVDVQHDEKILGIKLVPHKMLRWKFNEYKYLYIA